MKKIPKIINEQIKNNYEFSSNKEDKIKAAQFGYQLATDGREELEKENEGNKKLIDHWLEKYRDAKDQLTALQSQCTEKDNTISIYQQREEEKNAYIKLLENKFTEKEKECEALRESVKESESHTNYLNELQEQDSITIQLQSKQIEELKAENESLKEQYGIMDGRRERAIKSLEESEKQFGELQEAYNKLINL